MGMAHRIQQGEGGEQGDALMPLLFAVGQHRALEAVRGRLLPTEKLLAFLDDVYVVCAPERVAVVHGALREELWRHAGIRVHNGKTQLWNRSGRRPAGADEMEAEARQVDPLARVWRGCAGLPAEERGVEVLGTPLGSLEFVQARLRAKLSEHESLLERIPAVPDLQSAWVLLSYCAAARANYALRSIRPELTEEFAGEHGNAM